MTDSFNPGRVKLSAWNSQHGITPSPNNDDQGSALFEKVIGFQKHLKAKPLWDFMAFYSNPN